MTCTVLVCRKTFYGQANETAVTVVSVAANSGAVVAAVVAVVSSSSNSNNRYEDDFDVIILVWECTGVKHRHFDSVSGAASRKIKNKFSDILTWDRK